MVKPFRLNKKNKLQLFMLLDFVKKNSDYDFYITENNLRKYVDSVESLIFFLKNSVSVYVSEDEDYNGIVMVWKSLGGETERFYVKLVAANNSIAEKLLTILSWDFKKELFVKINKHSRVLNAFKNKGFRFQAGRGKQLLLRKEKMGAYNVSNTFGHRNSGSLSNR